jgi:integrase
MSAAHRVKGHKTYRVTVPTPTGSVKRYTGTRDKGTAKLYEVMLHELGPKGSRRWDLLEPVVEGRLKLAELFDAWRARDLDGLKARLDDRDLALTLPDWKAWLNDNRVASADRYVKRLATLHRDKSPWWRSTLTSPAIASWLAGLGVSGATQRTHAAALASFVKYARSVGHLTSDPLAEVLVPKAKEPEAEFLERDEVERLVKGSPAEYAQLFALLYGTGGDITPALQVRRRDVDLSTWMVRLPGTKTYNRDRVVIVAEWARPYLAQACKDLLPDAKLFGMDRWQATKTHKAILEQLEIRHMKLHATRNHWAVRALRGGWSVEAVARQLGHANGQMVLKVYGRFLPRHDELARMEQMAETEAVRRAKEG